MRRDSHTRDAPQLAEYILNAARLVPALAGEHKQVISRRVNCQPGLERRRVDRRFAFLGPLAATRPRRAFALGEDQVVHLQLAQFAHPPSTGEPIMPGLSGMDVWCPAAALLSANMRQAVFANASTAAEPTAPKCELTNHTRSHHFGGALLQQRPGRTQFLAPAARHPRRKSIPNDLKLA